MTLKEKLINDAQAFCQREGISLSRLATIVANEGKLFDRLSAGGDCTTAVYERFQRVFADADAWAAAKAADRDRRAKRPTPTPHAA